MRNGEILDEARETLIDRIYLIYLYLNEVIGRNPPLGDFFGIANVYEEWMSNDDLKEVLREFEILCNESAKIGYWDSFPMEALGPYKLFGGDPLKGSEWFLLQDYLAHESIPYIGIQLSPQDLVSKHFITTIRQKICNIFINRANQKSLPDTHHKYCYQNHPL